MIDGTPYLEGFGMAPRCQASMHHTPVPLRYVWHHIQPRVCGGPTTAANLVSVCDCCHYSIHALLWATKVGGGTISGPLSRLADTRRGQLAARGYAAAVAAGTVDQIPNEGIE